MRLPAQQSKPPPPPGDVHHPGSLDAHSVGVQRFWEAAAWTQLCVATVGVGVIWSRYALAGVAAVRARLRAGPTPPPAAAPSVAESVEGHIPIELLMA